MFLRTETLKRLLSRLVQTELQRLSHMFNLSLMIDIIKKNNNVRNQTETREQSSSIQKFTSKHSDVFSLEVFILIHV